MTVQEEEDDTGKFTLSPSPFNLVVKLTLFSSPQICISIEFPQQHEEPLVIKYKVPCHSLFSPPRAPVDIPLQHHRNHEVQSDLCRGWKEEGNHEGYFQAIVPWSDIVG